MILLQEELELVTVHYDFHSYLKNKKKELEQFELESDFKKEDILQKYLANIEQKKDTNLIKKPEAGSNNRDFDYSFIVLILAFLVLGILIRF